MLDQHFVGPNAASAFQNAESALFRGWAKNPVGCRFNPCTAMLGPANTLKCQCAPNFNPQKKKKKKCCISIV
jgi:hypothetical protein